MELKGFYNMDCMEGMKQIPDKYFDLAIVDPPYGININHNMGRRKGDKDSPYKKVEWDSLPPQEDYFKELFRVSKNQIVWGANHFISKFPFDSSCWLVWDKDNSGDFADCELAWSSFYTPVRKFRFRWNGMLQENMKNKEVRIHPTQKPVALYHWLLNNYAKEGDKILDTHVGSASSLIACHDLKFEYLGFELDEDYYNTATERIKKHIAQVDIFDVLEGN